MFGDRKGIDSAIQSQLQYRNLRLICEAELFTPWICLAQGFCRNTLLLCVVPYVNALAFDYRNSSRLLLFSMPKIGEGELSYVRD